jgi:septation ring formation regulator EzrA
MNNNDRLPETPSEQAAQAYLDACEHKLTSVEIDAIARDLHLPAAEIAELYAQLYADLKARARVTDYLRVLVSRKVRARYQGRRLS